MDATSRLPPTPQDQDRADIISKVRTMEDDGNNLWEKNSDMNSDNM